MHSKNQRQINLRALVMALFCCSMISSAFAEIRNAGTQWLRLRFGSAGGISTVVYEPGIPAELGGLPGITGEPVTVSDTSLPGGSGVFQVRVETGVNTRSGAYLPLTGTFRYDSSAQMTCTTPSTCGTQSIPFTTIRWNARDADTLNSVLEYDGTSSQVFQTQIDSNPSANGTATRHRNWYQFLFENNFLYPAGTYEGRVTINGEGS